MCPSVLSIHKNASQKNNKAQGKSNNENSVASTTFNQSAQKIQHCESGQHTQLSGAFNELQTTGTLP